MNNKGQFTIIAALFVAVILIATVIMTYSSIRNSPVQNEAYILNAIDETIVALKQVLGFTVGYYGSVLQVTGNNTYARDLAVGYFQSGLAHIANMHPEWGASFNVDNINMTTYWFTNSSYSEAYLKVNYSLNGLGIHGISYDTSCRLMVEIGNVTANNQAAVVVKKDEGEAVINLGKDNFKFYRYIYENSTWMPVSPLYDTSIEAYANGTYLINMTDPALSEIDPYSYIVQVQDPRGLVVVASSFSRYVCTINWNETFYQPLKNAVDATIVVELLQNGTMRWLGQNLQLTTQAKPIPPIPVKAMRVNQTINGVNQEVPFQIEDWASDYKIPLGLTNNASMFSNRNMLVFLINPNVTKVTIWWNGSDTVTQTSLAYTNRYFRDNPSSRTLSNGILTIQLASSGFEATATRGSTTSTSKLLRINDRYDTTDPEWAYAIYNGTVRSVVHGESEYSNGISNCPNVYTHIVLTLPANATYYTYQQRLIFLDAASMQRSIRDICLVNVTASAPGFFGSNAISSSYVSVSANYMYGSLFTSPSTAVIANSISFYADRGSGTANVKCLIVRHTDMQIVAITNPVSVTTTLKWQTATFSSPPVLSPNTEYVLMIVPDNTVRFYYADGFTDQGHSDTTNSYSSPTNPTDASHNNYRYSIYCNYIRLQTENGTLNGYPVISNEYGLFYNSSTTSWQHHWSQVSDASTSSGFGVMFTDKANEMLYFFEGMTGSFTGAINVTATSIMEVLPIAKSLGTIANFTYALDVTWYGAVVTFDAGYTPIYKSNGSGLWVLVEYPPIITVITEN
ncbi:MAG: hypothetical protein QXX51_05795 [Candidatus Bathyarchaeia archaeon]